MNAVLLSSEVNIRSRITNHDHAQIRTEMKAVLQLKTRILGELEAVYFLHRFSHWKRLAQLTLSPVPQSSPESSPPNRDRQGRRGLAKVLSGQTAGALPLAPPISIQ